VTNEVSMALATGNYTHTWKSKATCGM